MFITNQCFADLISCGPREIIELYVQADRDDNYPHENKLVIVFDGSCNGKSQAYIENTHPAYSGLLSTALMAFSTNIPVGSYINSSLTIGQANQLSILALKK